MAEVNLTLSFPGVGADELSSVFADLISSLGGAVSVSSSPSIPPHRAKLDPDALITLRQAAEEGPLTYYALRQRIVDLDEIPYRRQSAARKSPILIYRRDFWVLLDGKTVCRAEGMSPAEEILLGGK